jgi:hypothetical protein
MLTTVIGLLALAAFVAVILNITWKVPLYVSVLFLCIIELLRVMPLGR